MSGRPRIVIVGGGFAGLHLVRRLERALRRDEADVTLVDRNNYHLFTPLLYQVATGELPPHAVAYPLRRVTARAGYRFVRSEVEAVDVERRVVRTADGELPYDRAVIAPGSITNDYGIPGVGEHTLPMKDLADAHAVRKRIIRRFEEAEVAGDPARRRRLLTFLIIGAGPVGVELAASMRDLMENSLRPMYPSIDFSRDVTITLVDTSDRIIPQMDPRLSALAERRLLEQRIRLVKKTSVSEVSPERVLTREGIRFDAGTIVWAGGVRTSPLVASLDLDHAKDGRLRVDRSFRTARAEVFSLGDAAFFEDGERPLPQLAQVAVLQAPTVATNLARSLRGQPLAEYRHRPKGDLIALGRTAAGAHLPALRNVVFGGLPAWTAWRLYYLTQLLGGRNRLTLVTEWTLSFWLSRMVSDTP
ncbi:MAG: NAD(P)/FAD-dependent oxidoreductase [Candidatus Limnocylindria bacterium]